MKKALLVGGAGFIGHNLAMHMKQKNFDVYICDSLSVNNLLSFADTEIKNKKLYLSILNNRLEMLEKKNIKLIIQDARDYHSISKLYSNINPDVIIHLAAVSHANKSNKDPHSTFDHSLRTLENTLDFAKNNKTHLVYMSSSMVYGNFDGKSVNEDSPCKPIGIYGNLKLAGELMVKSYNQVFDLPYTIIRPSALYGERCVSRRVGQVFIENAIQGLPITTNGDGDEKLDFTYIEDLVEGISLCCEKLDKSKNQTFNITCGNARKVNELVSILNEHFNDLTIVKTDKEPFIPERGTLSNSRIKNILGFESSYSIERGYPLYIDWYKSFWKKLEAYHEIN